jgi:hypothetical protein
VDFSGQFLLITYLLFCLIFSLGWPYGISISIHEATTLVLSSVSMKNVPKDCPKLQHLLWIEGGSHQLESAFENWNQTVKKIILNSLCMPVSVLCLIVIWIQEFNWRCKCSDIWLFVLKSIYCVTNGSKIPHQKPVHCVHFLNLLFPPQKYNRERFLSLK